VCEKEASPAGLICTQNFRLIHWRSPSGAVANRTTFSSPEKVPSTGHRPARSPAMHARLCFFGPQKHWMLHMTMAGDGQHSDGSTSTSSILSRLEPWCQVDARMPSSMLVAADGESTNCLVSASPPRCCCLLAQHHRRRGLWPAPAAVNPQAQAQAMPIAQSHVQSHVQSHLHPSPCFLLTPPWCACTYRARIDLPFPHLAGPDLDSHCFL
jgi:hypothetical protein